MLETTNIVGCAYQIRCRGCYSDSGEPPELMPSPAKFLAGTTLPAILQARFLNQVMSSDIIFLTETRFHLDGIAGQLESALSSRRRQHSHAAKDANVAAQQRGANSVAEA